MEPMESTQSLTPTRDAVPLGSKRLYVVFDRVSGTSTAPVMRDNDAMAIREFSQVCLDEGSQYSRFPEDFTLRLVGLYNVQTCRTTEVDPVDVAFAASFKESNNG
jgi:hypothetical protein